jgi:ribosomal protein L7Ae-like RNA K-turn-binding protein
MLGSDEALLRTRSKVLGTIGCETHVVCGEEEARQEMEASQKPQLVILCHTADEEYIERVRRMALRAGIPTYSVEKMIPPQQLISDVKRVLKQDAGAQRRTTRA